MIIRSFECHADPGGRWVQPLALIFCDPYVEDDFAAAITSADPEAIVMSDVVHSCRAHLSAKREGEIRTRERALGWRLR